MKVLHVSYADSQAGAAIAAMRLHRALLGSGIDSRLMVVRKHTDDPTVDAPGSVALLRVLGAQFIVKHGRQLLGHQSRAQYSYNIFPSGLQSRIDRTGADLVHLHWVGSEAMSIAEIGRLRKPLVWTLHDMWPLRGADHYESEIELEGPVPKRPLIDLDRWTYQRKARHWQRKNFTLICPSRWMAQQAAQSSLFQTARRIVVPNAIDTDLFTPIDRNRARHDLGLPQYKRLVLFGAVNSIRDRRKGFDLLQGALAKLAERRGTTSSVEVIVFGAGVNATAPQSMAGFRAHFKGRIRDVTTLRSLYSAADVFLAPSRQDNLPNTVVEAQACGTPSIAFNVGGLADIVESGSTGYLVPPFDVSAFAMAISDALSWDGSVRERCRRHAEATFSFARIADCHFEVYRAMFSKQTPTT